MMRIIGLSLVSVFLLLPAGSARAALKTKANCTSPANDVQFACPKGWKTAKDAERDVFYQLNYREPSDPRYKLNLRWYQSNSIHKFNDGRIISYDGANDFINQVMRDDYPVTAYLQMVEPVEANGMKAQAFIMGLIMRWSPGVVGSTWGNLNDPADPAVRKGQGNDVSSYYAASEDTLHAYTVIPAHGGFYVLLYAAPLSGFAAHEEEYLAMADTFEILSKERQLPKAEPAAGEAPEPLRTVLDRQVARIPKSRGEDLDFFLATIQDKKQAHYWALRAFGYNAMSPVSYQNIEEVGARRLYPIFDALMDEDSQTQETAATSLLMMGVANHGSGPRLSFREPRVIETLVHCLKSQSSNARRDCAEMLGVVGDKSATLPLTALLKDPDTDVKKSAAGALGRAMKYLKDNRPVPGLIAALKDADQSVRSDAARALESAAEAKDARLPVPLFEAYSLDRNLSVPDEIKQLNNSSEAQALAQKWKEVSEQSGEAREEAGDALGALKGYAAELKEHPNDRALREKIIALAVSMNPKPRAPEEVDELEGQAVAAFKGAQSPADFGDAVNAYKKALLLAPWAAKDYFNLGVAQEKAGSPEDAIESFRYYLLAAPDAEDAKEVRARIGGLKYQAQKASASGGSERPAQGNAQAAAELLSAFKKNAPGRYYHWSVCRGLSGGGSLFAAVSRADGCTYAEYLGSNWFVNPGAGEFRYPADGTIEFWHLSGDSAHILMKGTPKGSRLEDIEWLRCDGQTMECNAPEWVYITPNFDHLTLSTNRPVNDAASDKEAKYRYGAYH